MNTRFKIGFLTFLWSLMMQPLFAQKDTKFWFACPNIVSGTGAHSDNHMKLCFISYDEPTTITISQPAASQASFTFFPTQTLIMPPGQLLQFDLTPYKYCLKDNAGGARPFGLYIEADHEIMAYFINTSDDCEAYTLKGQNALGQEFVVPMQYDYSNQYSGHNYIEIVATEDNTEVMIQLQPSITVTTGTPDASQQLHITLQKGWTYSLQASSTEGVGHLHNTYITATKPIAVNTTDDGVEPGDLMGDQILPVDMLGTKYIAIKNDGQTEYLYFFATEDSTHITVYSGSTTGVKTKTYLLNKGQRGGRSSRYSFSLKKSELKYKAVYIESDKPIAVFQMSGEEPAGAILPQLECTGSTEVSFQSVLDYVWADIITKVDYVDGFEVNGDPSVLTSADFDTVPGTNGRWCWARKSFVPNMVLRVKNTKGYFHLGMYDMRGNSSSLAYFSDFKGAELKAFTAQNFYYAGDSLVCTLYDADSYTNVVWTKPDGTTFAGNSLIIPSATSADAGTYYVSAEHIDGCTIASGAYMVTNIFEPQSTTIEACSGEKVVLTQSNGYAPYRWSGGVSSADTLLCIAQDTAFYQAYSYQAGSNVLLNGDFELDTMAFLSGYIYDTLLLSGQEHYTLTDNAKVSDPTLPNCFDHTRPTTGRFWLGECSNKANALLFSQSLSVLPNTPYRLSVWVCNPSQQPNASLVCTINGTPIGTAFSPSSQWTPYTFIWQGTTRSSLTLGIQTTGNTPTDTYVAIDDLQFCPLFEIADTMQVNALPRPIPTFSGDPYLCQGVAEVQAQEGFATYVWKKADGTVIGTQPQITLTAEGTYTLEVVDSLTGCMGSDTLTMAQGTTVEVELGTVPYICAHEPSFVLPYRTIAGSVGKCAIRYNQKALQAGFEEVTEADIQNDEIVIPLPSMIRPDHYVAQIHFEGNTACGGEQTIEQPFEVRYAAQDIMAQKWENILALYNEKYNGGYRFTAYQWYKNGLPLEGQNGSYLYLGNETLSSTDAYSVLLTRADDGVTLFSCDFTPQLRPSACPSLLSVNQRFEVQGWESGRATFYTLQGTVYSSFEWETAQSNLTAPSQAGIYILQWVGKNGVQSYKLIVR